MTRHNFASPKWRERIVVPAPVYITADRTDDQRKATEEPGSLPDQDVLVETFEAGQSMIDIMSAPQSHASEIVGEDNRGAHLKHMYNKEIAALGLDAILKMVRL
jgi:hypothetical protein